MLEGVDEVGDHFESSLKEKKKWKRKYSKAAIDRVFPGLLLVLAVTWIGTGAISERNIRYETDEGVENVTWSMKRIKKGDKIENCEEEFYIL